MSDIADTLTTKYVLDDQYSAKLKKISHETDKFGQSAKSAQSAVGGGSGGGNAAGMIGALAGVEDILGPVGIAIGVVTAAVGAMVAAAVAGAGKLVDFGHSAISAFAEYDSIERRFIGIYGSVKDAKTMMGYLNSEAQKGSFTFKALAESASKLVMSGMKFSDYNTAIQSIALRMGGGDNKLEEVANILLRLKGGGFGEAFQRLKESGVGTEELQRLGATFDKSGQFVGNVDQALQIFQKIGQESAPIAKAMEGGAASVLSNIEESMKRILASAGEGIFKGVKTGIASLVEDINTAIDSGVIAQTFQFVTDLFSDAADISVPKIIAGLLAGIQVAAGMVRVVFEAIKSFLSQPIVQAILKFIGIAGSMSLAGGLFEDIPRQFQNAYQSNLSMMESFKAKKAKSGAPHEPDNPKAVKGETNTVLNQIADHTKATSDNTKKQIDMSRHIFGGGDIGRVGLTPVELDSLVGSSSNSANNTVKVEVIGTSFDALLSEFGNKLVKQLAAQGRLR